MIYLIIGLIISTVSVIKLVRSLNELIEEDAYPVLTEANRVQRILLIALWWVAVMIVWPVWVYRCVRIRSYIRSQRNKGELA